MHNLLKLAAVGFALASASQLSAAQLITGRTPLGSIAQPRSSGASRPAVTREVVTTKTLSAIVFADGTLAVGPAGTTSDRVGPLPGFFEVIFPRDVSKCVYTATLGDPNPTTATPGFITVDPRGTTKNGVFVGTYNTSGAGTSLAFHLHVSC